MEKFFFCVANQILGGQELLALFRKLKVYCRFYKDPPSVTILNNLA